MLDSDFGGRESDTVTAAASLVKPLKHGGTVTRTTDSHRLFIALVPPQDALDALAGLIEELARALPRGAMRITPPENLHLTLHFLGDVRTDRVGNAAQAIDAACVGCAAFAVETAALGCFPSHERPRIAWIGLRDPLAVIELQRALGHELRERDFELERRSFSAHWTLARAERRATPRQLGRAGDIVAAFDRRAHPDVGFRVDRVTLVESELRRGGPLYRPLHVSRLAGERANDPPRTRG